MLKQYIRATESSCHTASLYPDRLQEDEVPVIKIGVHSKLIGNVKE
jgi:hypothetical protein